MRVATYAIALIVLATAATVAAQSVTVEGGNIFYRGGNGTRHQLTFSGLDSDVILSPDGKLVAFVRRTPDKLISTSMGDEEATEIWIINIDGKAARRLLTGTSAKEPQRSLANFRNLQFSPDGARIYFLSAGWVTSNAIYAVNRLTAKASFIAPGNSLEVIQRGTYAGHLIVEQHRYWLAGGSYDWLWLLDSNGREVGPIMDDNGRAGNFDEWRKMIIAPGAAKKQH